ncbi:MAG: helix-turn-helix transcriptional regulator [Acidimicrobiia bacterium]
MHKVIERILNLLAFLLTVGRPVTADEIRYTVKGYEQPTDEAFRRTFERDKDLLRSLGVPIQTTHTDVWEVELGYVVPSDDYTLDDPGLTDEERSALLLAADAVRFGGQPTELAAIFKLGGAPVSAPVSSVAADLGQDLQSLGDLFGAVSDKRYVRFAYRDREREVAAYGLIHRFGRWYLVGPESSDIDLIKVFRLDRMGDPSIDERTGAFERPVDFDASEALSGLRDEGPIETAMVRFDADVVAVAMRRWARAIEIDRDGSGVLVELPYASVPGLITWLLSFDDKAVLEGPPEVREAFVAYVGGSR